MKCEAVLLAAAIVLLTPLTAGAREPTDDERSVPPSPPPDDPVAFVVPAGLYYVTDTYVGDVVATTGATTTYSTTTVHESTGTYARILDTVGTGATSAFDGRAFNGRGELTDGRALAGTYYENFVLTANGYLPVSIVFFQDDSETRRQEALGSPTPPPASTAPTGTLAPAVTSGPAGTSAATRSAVTPAPSPRPTAPLAPARPALRAGVALAVDGPTLSSAEVLRGRLVQFWPRAFANDVAIPVRSWRVLSAEPDRISARSGGAEPFTAQWIRMPPPTVRWTLRFEVVTELAPAERLETQISITVRSPALIY
jgi:hypothetical protein